MRKYYNGEGNEIIGYDITITKTNCAQPYFIEGFNPWEYEYAQKRFNTFYENKNPDDIVELYEVVKEGEGDFTEIVSYCLANYYSPSEES